ncbi:class I SAM-dependent methyltransferase [Flavobacterium jejuense]|uniref:Class I SAM-dependent methyltransferase n=1 Tax=Flavobacterium jejuense TaxID=1544455 RepID=A0ABX0IKG7_9FLAO|nr:class I SAM-dependent methyltransferase [Flavobacterium jejuense]NHN24314.1 class I SAM-dependent methyltransferase [Flavobacterium jejuense]
MKQEFCLLCNESATVFCEKPNHLFYKCDNCQGIFRPKHTFFDTSSEKKHYEQHNNNVNDLGYQKFVEPLVNAILKDFSPNDKGLDFGSGTGPVISKMLHEKGYQVENYDIFFENVPEKLTQKYNYISCCEVMEHFHEPLKEFKLLHSMLLPNGKLYCKTELFQNQIPFENWYYKNDLTHVFIYQETTLHWIHKLLNFKKVEVRDKIILFEK